MITHKSDSVTPCTIQTNNPESPENHQGTCLSKNLYKLQYLNDARCPKNPNREFWKFVSKFNELIAKNIINNFFDHGFFSHPCEIETLRADRTCRIEIYKTIMPSLNPELMAEVKEELKELALLQYQDDDQFLERYPAIKSESSKWITAELKALEAAPKAIETKEADNTNDFFHQFSSATREEKFELLHSINKELSSENLLYKKYCELKSTQKTEEHYQELNNQAIEVSKKIKEIRERQMTAFSLLPFEFQQKYLENHKRDITSSFTDLFDKLPKWVEDKLKKNATQKPVSFLERFIGSKPSENGLKIN